MEKKKEERKYFNFIFTYGKYAQLLDPEVIELV